MTTVTQERVTNAGFAERVGVHFTMASKLRNGQRMPSTDTLVRIWHAFGLPGDEVLAAASEGEAAFGAYLRNHIFVEHEDKKAKVS